MAASVILEQLNGSNPVVVTSALAGVRFRADDTPLLNNGAPVYLPTVSGTFNLGAQVTASSTPQSVQVADSSKFAVGMILLISSGQPTQEAVAITGIPDGTHITALFGRNHILGAPFQQVTTSVEKVFQFRIATIPQTTISKVRFYRSKALPVGVFDHYRLENAYTQGTSTPMISDGTHLYSAVPSLTEEVIAPGPFATPQIVTPLVVIQWLYTADASGPLDGSAYRWAFDES